MVLYLVQRSSNSLCVFCRQVVGVHVAGDNAGFCFVQPRQIRRSPAKSRERLTRSQVADMLTEKYVLTDAEGDTVFQVRTQSQNARQALFHVNRQRCVAAGPSKYHLAPTNDAGD